MDFNSYNNKGQEPDLGSKRQLQDQVIQSMIQNQQISQKIDNIKRNAMTPESINHNVYSPNSQQAQGKIVLPQQDLSQRKMIQITRQNSPQKMQYYQIINDQNDKNETKFIKNQNNNFINQSMSAQNYSSTDYQRNDSKQQYINKINNKEQNWAGNTSKNISISEDQIIQAQTQQVSKSDNIKNYKNMVDITNQQQYYIDDKGQLIHERKFKNSSQLDFERKTEQRQKLPPTNFSSPVKGITSQLVDRLGFLPSIENKGQTLASTPVQKVFSSAFIDNNNQQIHNHLHETTSNKANTQVIDKSKSRGLNLISNNMNDSLLMNQNMLPSSVYQQLQNYNFSSQNQSQIKTSKSQNRSNLQNLANNQKPGSQKQSNGIMSGRVQQSEQCLTCCPKKSKIFFQLKLQDNQTNKFSINPSVKIEQCNRQVQSLIFGQFINQNSFQIHPGGVTVNNNIQGPTQNFGNKKKQVNLDKALEGLNETLQRLAREKYQKQPPQLNEYDNQKRKYETINTQNNQLGAYKPLMTEQCIQDHSQQNYKLAEEQFGQRLGSQGQTVSQKKEKKKKKNKSQVLEGPAQEPAITFLNNNTTNVNIQGGNIKQDHLLTKQEREQRVASLFSDTLVNQRLQGVKQFKALQEQANSESKKKEDFLTKQQRLLEAQLQKQKQTNLIEYDHDKMRQIYAKSSDNVQSKADSAQQKKQSLYKTQIQFQNPQPENPSNIPTSLNLIQETRALSTFQNQSHGLKNTDNPGQYYAPQNNGSRLRQQTNIAKLRIKQQQFSSVKEEVDSEYDSPKKQQDDSPVSPSQLSEDLPNNIEAGQAYKVDNQVVLHGGRVRVPLVGGNLGAASLLTSYGSTNYQHQKTTLSGIGAQNIMMNLRGGHGKERGNEAGFGQQHGRNKSDQIQQIKLQLIDTDKNNLWVNPTSEQRQGQYEKTQALTSGAISPNMNYQSNLLGGQQQLYVKGPLGNQQVTFSPQITSDFSQETPLIHLETIQESQNLQQNRNKSNVVSQQEQTVAQFKLIQNKNPNQVIMIDFMDETDKKNIYIIKEADQIYQEKSKSQPSSNNNTQTKNNIINGASNLNSELQKQQVGFPMISQSKESVEMPNQFLEIENRNKHPKSKYRMVSKVNTQQVISNDGPPLVNQLERKIDIIIQQNSSSKLSPQKKDPQINITSQNDQQKQKNLEQMNQIGQIPQQLQQQKKASQNLETFQNGSFAALSSQKNNSSQQQVKNTTFQAANSFANKNIKQQMTTFQQQLDPELEQKPNNNFLTTSQGNQAFNQVSPNNSRNTQGIQKNTGSNVTQQIIKKAEKPPIINSKTIQKQNDQKRNTQSSSQTQQIRGLTPPQQFDDYVSSDPDDSIYNLKLQDYSFKIPKDNFSFCQEYLQWKGSKKLPKDVRHLFTSRSFNPANWNGFQDEFTPQQSFFWSKRLCISRETAMSEDRRRCPVLIVNIDGCLGTWDDRNKNYFVLRQKFVDALIQLSYDFRIVAVSTQKQRLIYKLVQALMNMPPGPEVQPGISGDASTGNYLRHLVFDAVYKLNSECEEGRWINARKNIDQIHLDLSQVLLDMQFKPQPKRPADFQNQYNKNDDSYLTFWETSSYRPYKKVIIISTEQRYLFTNCCYSFDYNQLFQAALFQHEWANKAPVIIQIPHLRLMPKLSFEVGLQLLFCIQMVAQALVFQKQGKTKIFGGEIHANPNLNIKEVTKKLLSSKWRQQIFKIRKTADIRGFRVFSQFHEPFVDLELLDFFEAFSKLNNYFKDKKPDWIKLKKYYLKQKPLKVELSPTKLKQNLKVTFEESLEIRVIGNENQNKTQSSSYGRAIDTTHDCSKSDRVSFAKSINAEEAKNLYNVLMIRNYKIQQEINTYARHYRIQEVLRKPQQGNQTTIGQEKIQKMMKQNPQNFELLLEIHMRKSQIVKKEKEEEEEQQRPIVIFDEDDQVEQRNLKSSLKQRETEQTEPSIHSPLRQQKEYKMKFCVFKIRCGEPIDESTTDMEYKQHQIVNLKINPFWTPGYRVTQVSEQTTSNFHVNRPHSGSPQKVQITTPKIQEEKKVNLDYIQHTYSQSIKNVKENDDKNFLIELLSRRQNRINFVTRQDMHLQNALSQLIAGEQQYEDQQAQLIELEKENKEINHNQTVTIDYLDNL